MLGLINFIIGLGVRLYGAGALEKAKDVRLLERHKKYVRRCTIVRSTVGVPVPSVTSRPELRTPDWRLLITIY